MLTGSNAEFPFESTTLILVPGLPLTVVTLVTVNEFGVPVVGATVAIVVSWLVAVKLPV